MISMSESVSASIDEAISGGGDVKGVDAVDETDVDAFRVSRAGPCDIDPLAIEKKLLKATASGASAFAIDLAFCTGTTLARGTLGALAFFAASFRLRLSSYASTTSGQVCLIK